MFINGLTLTRGDSYPKGDETNGDKRKGDGWMDLVKAAFNIINNRIREVTANEIAAEIAKGTEKWEKAKALADNTLQECKSQDFTIEEIEMLIFELEGLVETIKKEMIKRATLNAVAAMITEKEGGENQ